MFLLFLFLSGAVAAVADDVVVVAVVVVVVVVVVVGGGGGVGLVFILHFGVVFRPGTGMRRCRLSSGVDSSDDSFF